MTVNELQSVGYGAYFLYEEMIKVSEPDEQKLDELAQWWKDTGAADYARRKSEAVKMEASPWDVAERTRQQVREKWEELNNG